MTAYSSSAFPSPYQEGPNGICVSHGDLGISKIEYYAGLALQGELACQCKGWTQNEPEKLAKRCFDIAEAMHTEAVLRGIA